MTAEVLGDLDLGREIRSRLPQCDCAADIGCGTGDMLEILSRSAKTVIGVDNSPKMLELAEERFSGDARMSLRIGEMTHLPLRDWEADLHGHVPWCCTIWRGPWTPCARPPACSRSAAGC